MKPQHFDEYIQRMHATTNRIEALCRGAMYLAATILMGTLAIIIGT